MKALLTQWIGGANTNKEHLPASGSASSGLKADAPSTREQSFLGLMMGFLGMGKEIDSPEGGTRWTGDNTKQSSDNAQNESVETTVGTGAASTLLATDANIGMNFTGTTQILHRHGQSTSAQTNTQISTEQTMKTPEPKTTVDPVPGNAVEGANKIHSTNVSQPSLPSDGSGEKIQATTKEASEVLNGKSDTRQSTGKKSGAALKTGQNHSAKSEAKAPLPFQKIVNKDGTLVKEFAVTTQQAGTSTTAPETETKPKTVSKQWVNSAATAKEGKPSAAEVFKKISQSPSTKTNGKKVQKPSVKNSEGSRTEASTVIKRADQQSALHSFTKQPNTVKPMPGKMIGGGSPASVELEMNVDTPQDFKGTSDKGFKDIQMNDLKAAHLSESGGRKTFSKQLAQVGKQQFSQQNQASKQAPEWKHHRFILKDGNAVHIAARTADGALQLQLNAGNGELGKIIQQHLQDIQQHVQQQLDIEIDLQMQDFGGQQAGEQESAAQNKSDGKTTTGQSSFAGSTTLKTGQQSVRYFGFNQNEWTA